MYLLTETEKDSLLCDSGLHKINNVPAATTPSASHQVTHLVVEQKVTASIFEQLDRKREQQAKDLAKERNDEVNKSLLNYAVLDFSHMEPLSKAVKPVYDRVVYSRIDPVRSKALQCVYQENLSK